MQKVRKLLEDCFLLCYNCDMRQKFDVGDFVKTTHTGASGIVLKTEPINNGIQYPESTRWHPDEYRCKVKFISGSDETRWVRAKWLKHISKIN